MKSYRIGLYEKALPDTLTWKEKLIAAKEIGYDYIEMSIDASDEKIARVFMNKKERQTLLNNMYEADLPIRSMSVSALTKYALGDEDEAIREKGLSIGINAIILAADLGIRTVMIPGYDIYYGESTLKTKAYFLENMRKLVDTARIHGVILGFETMENDFMNTTGKAMKYISLLQSPYMKIYPDTGNLTNAAYDHKHDVCEDLCLGEGDLIALHLKESLPNIYREVPFGSGHVDFERLIKTAWKLGIRRFVTELWYLGEEDYHKTIKDAFNQMTQILDKQ